MMGNPKGDVSHKLTDNTTGSFSQLFAMTEQRATVPITVDTKKWTRLSVKTTREESGTFEKADPFPYLDDGSHVDTVFASRHQYSTVLPQSRRPTVHPMHQRP
jgi:hypothetical protein